MRGKTVPTLALALICGFVAMYGVNQMMAPTQQAAPEVRDVVVAARDLKVEEVLDDDTVAVIQMPKSSVPEGSFSSVSELKSRWVRIPLLVNEPIIEGKLAPEGEPPGLVGRIPTGMRAFAVEVNEQTGVSGFILPDHRVDVIQNRVASSMGSPVRPRGETILQNVLVLAAGQVTNRPDDRSIQVRTVTLAVTQQQAEILVAAKAKGSLSLTLRGMGDDMIVESTPEPTPEPAPPLVAEVPEPEPEARPKPKPQRYHQTHVYRGFGPTGFYEAVDHRGRPVGEPASEPPRPTPNLPRASVLRYTHGRH